MLNPLQNESNIWHSCTKRVKLSVYGKAQGTQRGSAGVFTSSGEARWSEERQGAHEKTDARRAFCYCQEGGCGALGEEGLASYVHPGQQAVQASCHLIRRAADVPMLLSASARRAEWILAR